MQETPMSIRGELQYYGCSPTSSDTEKGKIVQKTNERVLIGHNIFTLVFTLQEFSSTLGSFPSSSKESERQLT